MVLTAKKVIDYAVRHKIGGPVSAYIPDLDVVNRALDEFSGLHSWRCFERDAADLIVRPAVTVLSTMAWIDSSHLLYDTAGGNPFATYIFAPGDRAEIGIAGAFIQSYRVTGKVDSNSITLDTTFADTSGLDLYLDTARLALPSDFAEIIHIEASDSLVRRFNMVSSTELRNLRSQPVPRGTLTTWGALSYAKTSMGLAPGTTATEGVPVMEIWPTSTTLDRQRFKMVYRAEPQRIEDDNSVIDLPQYAHSLLLDLAAAVASGYEAKQPVGAFVDQVFKSSTFVRTRRRDGLQSRSQGLPRVTAYGVIKDTISYSRALAESGDITNDPK